MQVCCFCPYTMKTFIYALIEVILGKNIQIEKKMSIMLSIFAAVGVCSVYCRIVMLYTPPTWRLVNVAQRTRCNIWIYDYLYNQIYFGIPKMSHPYPLPSMRHLSLQRLNKTPPSPLMTEL